jgi:hypothetical protein
MDKDRWAQKESKALGSYNIVVTTEFLSTDYHEPIASGVARALYNGRLDLFRIEPRRPNLPSFSGRWDLNGATVDIDLIGEAEDTRGFAMQRPGYRGHKTERVSDNPRTQALHSAAP